VGGNTSFDDWLEEKLGQVPPKPGEQGIKASQEALAQLKEA